MKLAKIFSVTALLSILLSGNVFAQELTSGSLNVVYNESEGAFKIYRKAVFKGNGTPQGDAFAKKCNTLEQNRIDKRIEREKYNIEHRDQPMNPKQLAHAKKLYQESRAMSEKMVKEGCFKR